MKSESSWLVPQSQASLGRNKQTRTREKIQNKILLTLLEEYLHVINQHCNIFLNLKHANLVYYLFAATLMN